LGNSSADNGDGERWVMLDSGWTAAKYDAVAVTFVGQLLSGIWINIQLTFGFEEG
jgi:hypothetical protein